MATGKILWGSASSGLHYENELVLGYSLYEPVDDRAPRAGSEWVQAPSGVEDAWITGQDYVLRCEARWIPDGPASTPQRSPIAGPNSWSQFLDYARAKNPFRFVPDASLPNFFVDGVYLVEPTSGLGKLDDTKLLRNVPLTFRQATVPWTQAVVRRVALEYAPGQPTTGTGLDAVFTRVGPAYYTNKAGVLVQNSSNVVRDRTYDGSTMQSLLLEAAAVNLLQWSEATTNWPSSGPGAPPTITPNYDVAPNGSTNAQLLAFTTNGALLPPTTNLSGTTSAWIAWYMKAGSTGCAQALGPVNSTSGLLAWSIAVAWSSATPPAPIVTPSSAGVASGAIAVAGGWYRVWGAGAVSSSAVGYFPYLHYGNAGAGQVEVWGAHMGAEAVPASYVPTTGAAAASRNVDSFNFPLPAGFQTPQPSWAYIKFVERGAVYSSGFPRLLTVGLTSAGLVAPNLQLLVTPNTSQPTYRCAYNGSTGAVSVIMSTAAPIPVYGDTVELLATLSSSGVVALRQVVNGGAEVSAPAPSNSIPLASSWSSPTLWLGAVGGGVPFNNFAIQRVKMGPGAMPTIAAARSA